MTSETMMTLTGIVELSTLGLGAWSLVSAEQTYEIYQQTAPAGLLQDQQRVKVTGRIRQDVMTMAMIGPVFEVVQFESV